jgi:hypothetical protein
MALPPWAIPTRGGAVLQQRRRGGRAGRLQHRQPEAAPHVALNRRAADLAVPLRRVAVADREECAWPPAVKSIMHHPVYFINDSLCRKHVQGRVKMSLPPTEQSAPAT